MFTCDVNFDRDGNPILLFVTSRKGEPGPAGDPREWTILHGNGGRWTERIITTSDHNYDMGSLFVDGSVWTVLGPTERGPQRYGTGGEMAVWQSGDEGATWTRTKNLTSGSRFNHSYARRPDGASAGFQAFWADGDPGALSESRLYFYDALADIVVELPWTMDAETFPCAR